MTSSSRKPNGHLSLSLFEFLPVSTVLITTLPHGGAARVISSLHRKVGENGSLLGCPETSVRIHHYSLRNNPEVRSSQRFPTSVLPISASSLCVCVCVYIYIYIYRVSQEECARLREGVPYAKVYRYNPKHLCPKLNGYGDNRQRSLKL